MTAPDPAPPPVEARFVRRVNRFVAEVRLADGAPETAYVPNTARLHDLLLPDARVALQPARAPHRTTRWTLTRVRDGAAWVALEASAANDLLADWLVRTGELSGIGAVAAVRREVAHGDHRLDLQVDLTDGRQAWVEVKSLSRGDDGDAHLSRTPSTRATAHLAALGRVASPDVPAVVAFVVQRGDVDRLVIGPDADPDWVVAVRHAAAAGVQLRAYACDVTPEMCRIARQIPVVDAQAWRTG